MIFEEAVAPQGSGKLPPELHVVILLTKPIDPAFFQLCRQLVVARLLHGQLRKVVLKVGVQSPEAIQALGSGLPVHTHCLLLFSNIFGHHAGFETQVKHRLPSLGIKPHKHEAVGLSRGFSVHVHERVLVIDA